MQQQRQRTGVVRSCFVKMADKLLNRKGDLIRDQLECNPVPMDSNDPMYDSETEVRYISVFT